MSNLQAELSQFLKEAAVEEKKKRIIEIEKEMERSEFWKNAQLSTQLTKELSFLQKEIEQFKKLEDLAKEGKKEEFQKLVEKAKVNLYLSGKYDRENAIFALHAGQGGVEAMDWTQMLFRMYTRFFDKKQWQWEMIDQTAGEEAGIKSITLTIADSLVYGLLKSEKGVHRLVRQSPFNADHLRQTSFALVEVWPLLQEAPQIDLKEEDLEWDFFRASGHGGQHVNKASTAVRVKHTPTGMVVTCQQERSQAQNRESALRILRAKLLAKKEQEEEEKVTQLKGEYQLPGWGRQIRSYVLHPYHLVKDLRTGFETQDTERILSGGIEPLIYAYLKKFAKKGKVKGEE